MHVGKNIILFGGTFDPPHIGHIILAQRAKEFLSAEKVIFIPCYIPPHKLDYKPTLWKHRLNMLNLSLKNLPSMEVSDYEIRVKGVSYTYNTVQWFKKKFPEHSLYFLIGMDSLLTFTTWHRWQDIISDVSLIVGNRISEKRKIPEELLNTKKIVFFNSPKIEVSSSEIRQRVKENKSIKFLVAPEVEKYIFKHKLYQ